MFKIVTDSSANLTNDLIRKYDIKIASLSYVIGSDLYSGVDAYSETSLKKFLRKASPKRRYNHFLRKRRRVLRTL